MRTLTLVTISALSLLSLSSLACGGSTPPKPATPPGESNEADASAPSAAADMPATSEAATATPDAGATESASTPAASASAAPAPTGPDLSTQGQAECAGIAAPFEERVRAKFNECYQAGKKKNPELAGTIKVTLKVDTKGKVTKYVPDPSKLDKPVFDCMVKVVKKEPFDGKACAGKDVTVSKTYGR